MSAKPVLELRIRVKYDANGVSMQTLESMLGSIARWAAGEGMFTGHTEAEVDTWDSEVVRLS